MNQTDKNNSNNIEFNNQSTNVETNMENIFLQQSINPNVQQQQFEEQNKTNQNNTNLYLNQSNQQIDDNLKKKKIGPKIFLIILIVIILIVSVLFNSKKMNKNENIKKGIKSGSEIITSKDIDKYNLKKDTIWINQSLGITYDIPKRLTESIYKGSPSFSYLHGNSFNYYNGYKIYVEKSLEGHKNLKTLASDIIGEKNSDKYKIVYKFGSDFLKEFDCTETNNVMIDDYDTVYFESEYFETKNISEETLKVKLIGYSFKYEDEYISIYGELLDEEESKLESLKQMLQYIINSIKPYDGKSLQELNGNVKNYYDDGYDNDFQLPTSSQKFSINLYSGHVYNGILGYKKPVNEINKKMFTWDGTMNNIFEQLTNYKFSLDFEWNNNSRNSERINEIVNEKKENINGIDFYEYTIRDYYNSDKKSGKIIVVYFFQINDNPYVLQYVLNSSIYNEKKLGELTQEEQEVVIKQTEIVAKSYVLTFRLLDENESSMTYASFFY